MSLLAKFLEWLAPRFLEERRIHVGGHLYLRRFYVLGQMEDGLAKFWNCGKRPRQRFGFLPTVYLHCFHRPDADRWMHNHPWSARGLILTGGYIELRYPQHPSRSHNVLQRTLRPGSFQKFDEDTYHNIVTLLDDVVWTVLATGTRTQGWGFWDPVRRRHVPWHRRSLRFVPPLANEG